MGEFGDKCNHARHLFGVEVDIAEDESVEGGFEHSQVPIDLSHYFGEVGVSSPTVIGENGLIVAKSSGCLAHSLCIFNFILVLVQSGVIVRLDRSFAPQAIDFLFAVTFASVLVTSGCKMNVISMRTADVTVATGAPEQIAFRECKCRVFASVTPATVDIGFADTLTGS